MRLHGVGSLGLQRRLRARACGRLSLGLRRRLHVCVKRRLSLGLQRRLCARIRGWLGVGLRVSEWWHRRLCLGQLEVLLLLLLLLLLLHVHWWSNGRCKRGWGGRQRGWDPLGGHGSIGGWHGCQVLRGALVTGAGSSLQAVHMAEAKEGEGASCCCCGA